LKEDILEQAVDDWFLSQDSTFTKHNIKFKPDPKDVDFISNQDSVFSDIDVLAVHLKAEGVNRVSAASCKSWQEGLHCKRAMNDLLNNPNCKWGGREVWKSFRELVIPKWGRAFAKKIFEETLCKDFTYYLFVTRLSGSRGEDIEQSRREFENCSVFLNNLRCSDNSSVKIKIVTFKEIVTEHFLRKKSTTLESTEIGRLLQIFRASDIEFK